MSAALPSVLFVDDEERILRSLRMLFRGRCEILATTSGQEAIEWVRQRPIHVVVSDQRMPGVSGVEVLRAVAEHSPATMRILLTGYADMDAVAASVNEGEIYRFVEKPWEGAYLLDVVDQAARVAMRDFAAAAQRPAIATKPAVPVAAHVVVLDDGDAIAAQVRELLPAAVQVEHARDLEAALTLLADHDVAVVVARLSSAHGDVADALKRLKRLRPATLAIVISPLRDSRLVIELINQGQIFRFLLQPPVRELLRRGLLAALERHVELRANASLVQRYDVEPARGETATIPGRLLQIWRRIREAAVARAS
ncbi:response regulator [Dokdonella sp.]|uniref:response regulator n=1 Tax=Dokdonella sp. TaxID=2291710 RepID=UPI001B238D57|nr:response regulator [Dokdonella sp.]MBO9663684.1 response regulator [Dokdonella sp.]